MKIIDNFLEKEMLEELEAYVKSQLDKPVWVHGHQFYKQELKNYIVESMAPYIATVEGDIREKLKKYLLDKEILCKEPTDFLMLIYNTYPLSSVGWHTDKHDEYEHGGEDCVGCKEIAGISIYLNKEWEPNWGGFFLLKDKKEDTQGKFFEPLYNRAIINDGYDVHGVSAVSNGAKNRYSVQVFVDRPALSTIL